MAAKVDQSAGAASSSGRRRLGPPGVHALGVPFHRRGAIPNEDLEAIKTACGRGRRVVPRTFVSFRNVRTARSVERSPSAHLGRRRQRRRAAPGGPIRRRLASESRPRGLAPRLRLAAAPGDREYGGQGRPALCPRIRLGLTESPLPDGNASRDKAASIRCARTSMPFRRSAPPTCCSTRCRRPGGHARSRGRLADAADPRRARARPAARGAALS